MQHLHLVRKLHETAVNATAAIAGSLGISPIITRAPPARAPMICSHPKRGEKEKEQKRMQQRQLLADIQR